MPLQFNSVSQHMCVLSLYSKSATAEIRSKTLSFFLTIAFSFLNLLPLNESKLDITVKIRGQDISYRVKKVK